LAWLFVFFVSGAHALTVTLTWDAPVGYTPTGYVIGYGETRASYSTMIDVGNSRVFQIDGLQPALTYYFSVMAYVDQTYSAWASEVAVTVLQSPPPASVAVSPAVGLWWNSAESGTGYSLDFKHGVLVVTIYSYNADGTPQWYLASGPLSGATFTAPLQSFFGGQCISCAFSGAPTAAGSDETMTIVFSSAHSAAVYLPGGRITQITPMQF
jgi:hypothetical protein